MLFFRNLLLLRIRASKYEDVDAALFRWFREVRAQSIPESGPVLQQKAKCLGALLGHDDFNPLNGWIQRFKDRPGISCKAVCGESGAVDDESIEVWLHLNLESMLSTYTDRDIYNADEAGLFYNFLPNRTLVLKGEACSGRKVSKERITVLFCANFDGSDKRRLFVIGKSARPCCFKMRECLPVTYKANKKAWMTQDLLTSWLCKFDEDMVAEKRWVVLILDNCTAHNVKPKLTTVNLKFLPASTTAKNQPLDQSVIATVKALYKKRICERVLLSMQQQQPLKVNLRGAIDMVVASWWQVKADTISKCFKRAGFVRNAEALEDDEQSDTSRADETLNTDDVWSCLVDSNFVTATDTFQEFVDAGESELSVCEEASTDDAIVAAVRGSAEVATDDESDSEEDVDPTPEPDFPCKDALEYLAKVKTYCAKNSLSEKSLQCLSFVEDEIVRSAVRKHCQTKITAFFR
nr:tigger transposable element-derived protein 6-like [Rhipicephalus microplus]